MNNPDFLQRNLRRRMDAKGWSIKDFSDESSVSYHTVFRAVSKGVVSRGSNLAKMAHALGCDIADLWIDPDKPAPKPKPVHEPMSIRAAADEILRPSDYALLRLIEDGDEVPLKSLIPVLKRFLAEAPEIRASMLSVLYGDPSIARLKTSSGKANSR